MEGYREVEKSLFDLVPGDLVLIAGQLHAIVNGMYTITSANVDNINRYSSAASLMISYPGFEFEMSTVAKGLPNPNHTITTYVKEA